jgi:hypothetical protein
MHKRLLSIAVGAVSIPALGLAAYGASHAVSDTPAPQVVIPATSQLTSNKSDDPANHDINEVPGADDSPNHEANEAPDADDPVSAPATTQTTLSHSDDGPGHDVGDDHGGRVTIAPTGITRVTSVPDSSGSSGRGSSGHGSGGTDDGPSHH